MISGVLSSTSFGFDRVFLSGGKGQRSALVTPDDQANQKNQETQAQNDESVRNSNVLSTEDQSRVDQLAATDRKVRAHEMAHVSVGGDLVQGGANFDYQTGPDGKRYAVGGEVSIDTSKGRTPEETIPKAQKIRAAALAPADPSPQDNRVAALATRMEMQAYQELALQRAREASQPEEGQDNASSKAVRTPNERAVAAYQAVGASGQSSVFRVYA